MTTPDTLIESILAAAVELHTPAERHAYIAQACGGDTELQKQVEQMLENYFQAGSFLETPAPGLPKTIAYPQETVGKIVGPYKLLEKLGEGGMGTVWIAEREKPVRQRVALKLIKPGMDSAQVLRRFEAERQALALMTHHNIARMLDAGTTEAGRPYFVMELVKGVPITKYCDEVHAPIEERLKLFIPVCLAVQHAHQKGIIHRDIKPSNVLVCMEDGQPVPKVIDFGVAKALYQPLTEGTLHTAFNQIVGTLEYMSPEQAELNALDIDTRADIYALGVLLFELLTGSTPITREELKTLALMGMLRKIKESEPKKPSTRLSESKDTLASVAASRRSDPRRLMKEIAGDLDWIVLKCLEPDRMRRYETANAVAREIERHLANEPVEARAPSRGYRLKKFVMRNRWAVAAASLILLALLTGVIGLSWGWYKATRAEENERVAKDSALKRLGQIEKGNELLGSIFFELDPRTEAKEGKPLRAILGNRLEKAAGLLDHESIGDQLTLAKLQHTLGRSLLGLGFAKSANPLLTFAYKTFSELLGSDHPLTLECLYNLATSHRDLGKFEQALPLYEQAVTRSQSRLGNGHADTIRNMNGLGNMYFRVDQPLQGQTILESALKLARENLSNDHEYTHRLMNSLGVAYQKLSKNQLALPLFEEALLLTEKKFGPDSPRVMSVLINLANSYEYADKLELALQTSERALKIAKAKLGPDHPDTLGVMQNLATTLAQAKKYELAIQLLEQCLIQTKSKLGAAHPQTMGLVRNIAMARDFNREKQKAVDIYEQHLKELKQEHGSDYPALLFCTTELAERYASLGNTEKAQVYLQESGEYLEKQKPMNPSHKQYLTAMCNTYDRLRKYDQSLIYRRILLDLTKSSSGEDSYEYARELHAMGQNCIYVDQFPEAEIALEQSLQLSQRLKPDAWQTFNTMSALGSSKLGQQKVKEAEPLLIQGYEGLKARKAQIPRDRMGLLSQSVERLMRLNLAKGNQQEADRLKKEREDIIASYGLNSETKP